MSSTQSQSTRGGTTAEALSKGSEKNYACDRTICLPPNFQDASQILINHAYDILEMLEEENHIVDSFTIGKTLVRRAKRRQFSTTDPITWRKEVRL